MVKININMPNECILCPFGVFAYDSGLFNDGECFCCIQQKLIESYIENETKPEWCPLIEC